MIIEGEFKNTKLLVDLNFEKGLEIDEIMEIEIRLEKPKISETAFFLIIFILFRNLHFVKLKTVF